jgi:hypothetical protein
MTRKILLLVALLMLLSVGTAFAQDDEDLDIDTAWQPFEHGVMMWFRDCDRILVMFSASGTPLAGGFVWVEDNWETSMGNPSANPPQFRFTPQRGFGHIWQQNNVREALGWGLARELGYDSSEMDCDPGEDNSYEIDGPGDTEYLIVFGDGNSGAWATTDIG